METTLFPCHVPWAVSPTNSGVTLIHSESDVSPECQVVFGAGRLIPNGKVDLRRIEITFHRCYLARTGHHKDNEGVEAIGYRIDSFDPPEGMEYLDWRRDKWRRAGYCPDSGFYVANPSEWLKTLPEWDRHNCHHYVIDGRNGYVEVIAESYEWKEWLCVWKDCHRYDVPYKDPTSDQGTSK